MMMFIFYQEVHDAPLFVMVAATNDYSLETLFYWGWQKWRHSNFITLSSLISWAISILNDLIIQENQVKCLILSFYVPISK